MCSWRKWAQRNRRRRVYVGISLGIGIVMRWKYLQKHVTFSPLIFHHYLIKVWHLQRADTTPDSAFKVSAEQTTNETSFSSKTRSRNTFVRSFLLLAEQNTLMHLSQRTEQRTGFPLLGNTGAIKPSSAALNPCAWFKGPVLPKSWA